MAETFCGICKHPTGVGEGHYSTCPVLTGEPVLGTSIAGMGINSQDMQPALQSMQAPINMLQQMGGIGNQDGYEVAKIYREARQRLLDELKMQVEINHRQGRELIELRLENQELKETIEEQHKVITDLSQPRVYTDDNPPF